MIDRETENREIALEQDPALLHAFSAIFLSPFSTAYFTENGCIQNVSSWTGS